MTRKADKTTAQLDAEIAMVLMQAGVAPPHALPMSYEEAKAAGYLLARESSAAGMVMKSFPRNSIGLASDAAKASPEYRSALARSRIAFAREQAFNAAFVKRFDKETRADRAKRDAERQGRR
jgi:hypothetical protein